MRLLKTAVLIIPSTVLTLVLFFSPAKHTGFNREAEQDISVLEDDLKRLRQKLHLAEVQLQQVSHSLQQAELLLTRCEPTTGNITVQANLPSNAQPNAAQTDKAAIGIETNATSNQAASDTVAALRQLASNSPFDVEEQINTLLLSEHPNDLAALSRIIYEWRQEPQSLPDYLVSAIYDNGHDDNLRRISAQVLAQRGDYSLLEDYVAEQSEAINSNQDQQRSQALYALSQTNNYLAVPLIHPLLNDPNASIRADALMALRATGNGSHVAFAQELVGDSNQQISALAKEVVNLLNQLPEDARQRVSQDDIKQNTPDL
ncbi:HEAT repeat domain-containing protein [Agarivorans sp. DSG3-1]|uniref:HEAT repeat domain-containing protein n=1 Tax=Agarivorans sp. DSG3-1 TaxID=3342249 RepID=UPI00398F12EE